jgi:hypothetical protein
MCAARALHRGSTAPITCATQPANPPLMYSLTRGHWHANYSAADQHITPSSLIAAAAQQLRPDWLTVRCALCLLASTYGRNVWYQVSFQVMLQGIRFSAAHRCIVQTDWAVLAVWLTSVLHKVLGAGKTELDTFALQPQTPATQCAATDLLASTCNLFCHQTQLAPRCRCAAAQARLPHGVLC